MRFTSIHECRFAAPVQRASELLDGLSSEEDRLWPHGWPEQRFDGPLAVGATGGHGPIRYSVEAYEPGRLVSYRFLPATGFGGRHWFEVVPLGQEVLFRHVVHGRAGLGGWLLWHGMVRWLHDALLRDALDNARRELTGCSRPTRWSPWVRVLRGAAVRFLGGPAAR
ncbi:MAG: hypothetical protein KTR31_30780 [Myxococcales bacterium]|nr:hypothetical protein [Myxococcales bacterium]